MPQAAKASFFTGGLDHDVDSLPQGKGGAREIPLHSHANPSRSILPYVPLLITVAAFMVMSKIQSAMVDKACAALVGQEAPNIDLIEQASGSQTTLKEFLAKNKKPTVIDFYQNFCPACGPAADKIEQLAGDAKYKDKVNFMLVNMGSRDDAVKYAKERNLKDAWHGHGKPPSGYGIKCHRQMSLLAASARAPPGRPLRTARNHHNTGVAAAWRTGSRNPAF
ncbi:hypothetical protein AK812_SmicGene2551 [Symbiodinium microadriaticum]|uniref:Thioredoxin domain-containing protein n=1 Tax=Symbiodinium microadriaticum TaxID=2951 RepID=A0A1Q9F184_SYMMI|nr:hypothetical protein AK812_SmicGene2551 [Symbiodinium microadriaticum]